MKIIPRILNSRRIRLFIADTLFSVNGGVNCSFEAGYWAADKFDAWWKKKQVKYSITPSDKRWSEEK